MDDELSLLRRRDDEVRIKDREKLNELYELVVSLNENVLYFKTDILQWRARVETVLSSDLEKIEAKIAELDNWKSLHIKEYDLDQPSLSVLRHIASFGMVFRWVIIFFLGVLSAVGVAQPAFEILQKWLSR